MAAGLASDRLMRLAAQLCVVWAPKVTMPVEDRPLMAPLAAKSMVPVGEGERVRSPARLMSPSNAVARTVEGMRESAVAKGAMLFSARRSQGWYDEAVLLVLVRRSCRSSQIWSSGAAELTAPSTGSVAAVRSVTSPLSEVAVTEFSGE